MHEIAIELNENQYEMLDLLLELQEGALKEDDFKNLVFVTGLCLLFEKLVSEEISLEESKRA
jgi:hypothetical protein